jgi:hypothetical protein
MRKIILILSLVSSITSIAQQVLPIQHDTLFEQGKYAHELIMSGIADYNSTSLDNDLMKKMVYGGVITEGIKNHSFGNHGSVNRFGADISAEMDYRNYALKCFKKEQIGFLIKGGYYNYASLIYSKDLFGLTFYGNEKYLGQSADFSGTRFLGMAFQKVGFGFFNKQSKNAVSLNFYSISNYAEGNIFTGELFQSPSVDSVSLALIGNMDFTSAKTFVKGWGAGIDLDFRLPVKINETRTAIVRFEAKNLGICAFNEPLTRYQADTIIHFQGYTLDQLFSNSGNSSTKLNMLDSLGVDSLGVRKWRFIPAYIQVGKIVSENDPAAVQTFYGLRMYGLSAFAPMLYGGIHYKLAKFADLGISAAIGGFGKLRFGLYSNWKLGNCYLGIGSENLTGMFQRNAKGESISIRLRCAF